MNPDYEPEKVETRQVYGVYMQQQRNDYEIKVSDFTNVATKNKTVSSVDL